MKQVTTGVGFQDSLGNLILSGKLILTLSQAAEITSGGGLVAPKTIVLPLDAITAKIAPTNIWFNDELTPTGTTYHAELLDSGGNIIADFGQWSITGASADLSTMVPVTSSTISLPGVVLLNPVGAQSIIQPTGTSLSVNRFENIRNVDSTTAGADWGAKVATAIADLPSTGGTIDARSLEGAQVISADPFVGITKNITLLVGAATITSSVALTPSTGVVIRGISSDATQFVFSGATNGFTLGGNAMLHSMTVSTSNAGGLIGVRYSGLKQLLTDVVASRTGAGVWQKGFQNFGSVTATMISCYSQAAACTVGLDLIDNAGNQVGGFKSVGCEWRGVTTGVQANNVLSAVFDGGSIESCGTNGFLAPTTANAIAFIGVEFEQNGTNDVSITTGGDYLFDGCQFGGGTTNNFNCPNTTCTASIRVIGCVAPAAAGNNWIFGNAIARSWLIGNKFKGAALTNGSPTKLTLLENFDRDGTPIPDALVADSTGASNLKMIASAITAQFQQATGASGNFTFFYNGSPGWHFAGGASTFCTDAALQVGTTLANYNAIATAGNGIPSIYGSTSQKTETAADTNVLTYTPPAAVGVYRVSFALSVSAANTATLGWTATWTDSNGNAQTPTNLNISQQGTQGFALTFTTSAAGNYYGSVIIDTNNAGANIVVKLTFSGTSFAGKASATVERLI